MCNSKEQRISHLGWQEMLAPVFMINIVFVRMLIFHLLYLNH